MNYNHLYYFYVTAREGTLRQAAQKLNVSQSTVSEQLKLLENAMETPLFAREKGKLRLNRSGEVAFKFAKQIFDLAERMERAVQRGASLKGTVREIGVSHSVSRFHAVGLFVPLFRRRDLRIRVRRGNYTHLVQALLRQDIDILVTDDSTAEIKGVVRTPIHEPEYHLVCGRKLYQQCISGGESVDSLPFIHYTQDFGIRAVIDHYFDEMNMEPQVLAEVDDTDIMVEAVTEGLSAAVLPKEIIEGPERAGEVKTIARLPKASLTICADYQDNPEAVDLAEIVEELKRSYMDLTV